MKAKLKEWNRNTFGRVGYRKNLALEQVEYWDAKEKISRLSLEELEGRKEAREDYKKWVLLEEITWRQKSREMWLKKGDRNTGFFHKMANAHRRRNNVERIKINRVWLTEENGIREGIANAFRLLPSNSGEWRPSVSGLQFKTLEPLDASALEIPFTEEEDFMKADVMCFFKEFYENGKFVKSLNATFMVLANRLKKVVGKVVSKAQGAFVEGRQILDAVLIANEVIDSIFKNNESGILCKLDIEKAYDNVDWTFILTVMQKMGFREKWIRWIKWCISTTSFSVLVNGTPTGFFQSSRGLRQGDPLSPYLFVIDMEAISRLRINLEKNELIPIGRVENVDDLAWEFGCRMGSLPTTYLGMPLGVPFKSITVWDGVEERFQISQTEIRKNPKGLPLGWGNSERKPHLVRWELVCLSKKNGGLGVKCLSILNKALLAKWDWRFANEREALWNQVIRGSMEKIEGEEGEILEDRWCGDSPLCMSFPSLFALAVEKEAWVADFWDPLAEGEEAERFLERLHGKRVIEDVKDMVSWTETKSGKFSVKSLYVALEAGCSSLFPSSYIWNVNVQPKISFFAWEATWGKALTLDMVQKRGQAVANRCFMCLEKEETINHLLLYCSRTKELWDLLFTLFGVSSDCLLQLERPF
ncbi:putative ribonuclease H protein [Vitis vinifera]|uniref:Putative ribonuclease H protein n=1 Tax=Vitis vinifera TaxID=29760 RepID=A0A438JG88_VITVI|nr:putative ribonuclease H protein [Vitis vinifera]